MGRLHEWQDDFWAKGVAPDAMAAILACYQAKLMNREEQYGG
jgi:hypothetical protein